MYTKIALRKVYFSPAQNKNIKSLEVEIYSDIDF